MPESFTLDAARRKALSKSNRQQRRYVVFSDSAADRWAIEPFERDKEYPPGFELVLPEVLPLGPCRVCNRPAAAHYDAKGRLISPYCGEADRPRLTYE